MMAGTGSKPKAQLKEIYYADQFVGTGAALTINDGINRTDGVPVLDIFKCHTSASTPFTWCDTIRGPGRHMVTNSNAAEAANPQGIAAYTSTGFTLGSHGNMNLSGGHIIRFTFREAPKFFMMREVAHVQGNAETVDLSMLGTVGMVVVKRRDGTSNWSTQHQSNPFENMKFSLNSSAVGAIDSQMYTISGTTLAMSTHANAATGSYMIYAWANDASPDGFIRCGAWTSLGIDQVLSTGGEPSFLFFTHPNTASQRYIIDDLLGFGNTQCGYLQVNNAVQRSTLSHVLKDGGQNGVTIGATTPAGVYLCVKDPRGTPKDATQVFQAAATPAAATARIDANFRPDMALLGSRSGGSSWWLHAAMHNWNSYKNPAMDAPESSMPSLNKLAARGLVAPVSSGNNLMAWMLRRASGVYEQVAYIGNGNTRTVAHRLGVAPEMIWVTQAGFYAEEGGNEWGIWMRGPGLVNNESVTSAWDEGKTAVFDIWGGGSIGNNLIFNLGGGDTRSNYSGVRYTAHLFATLPGISKVTSYVGNGASRVVDCGFSNGARGVMIKKVSGTGAWLFYDASRGIVAGNDPRVGFNYAESSLEDGIDPDPSGFVVNKTANTTYSPNESGQLYMVLAFA